MRGKHARKKANQRQRDHDAAVTQLQERIADERAAVAVLEAELAELHALAEHLAALRDIRDRAVADDIARLDAVIDELDAAVSAEERHAAEVSAAWNDVIDVLIDVEGGGVDGLEAVMRRIGVMGEHGHMIGDADRGLSAAAATRIQRARGERRTVSDRTERGAGTEVFLRPSVTAAGGLHPRAAANRGAQIARSSVFGHHVDTIWPWWAHGLITADGSPLRAFGAVGVDDIADWLAAGPHSGIVDQAAKDTLGTLADAAARTGRWRNPHQSAAQFPRPSDTAALRWFYWSAATASALAAAEHHGAEHPDAAASLAALSEPHWSPTTPVDELWQSAARMVAAAVPYWLPAGQTANYLHSEPLDDTDRNELRLPYQHVAVVPAEPLVIDPVETPTGDEQHQFAALELTSRRIAGTASTAAKLTDLLPYDADPPTLERAIEVFGAEIEAVVCEADGGGVRTNRILWCVAIPTRRRDAVLGRFTIPAFADRGLLGDIADQFAAVAAWGRWSDHDLAAADGTDRAGPVQRRPRSIVNVLDVGRTSPADTHSSTPTGRTVAPHMRRGHWRRQRHGPGSTLVKRVRIAPVLVNSTRGPLAPQIYRLPRLDEPRGTADRPAP
jgi:hypothetical protein